MRELKQAALIQSAEQKGIRQRIEEMAEFLNGQPGKIMEYDEQLVRRLIEKITIHENKIAVEFKSYVEIDIEI